MHIKQPHRHFLHRHRLNPKLRAAFARLAVAVTIVTVSAAPTVVTALSKEIKEKLPFFAKNNIVYYDPSVNVCATSTGKSDGSDVTMIGDSITVHSEAAIKKLLPEADIDSASGTYFTQNTFGTSGLDRLKAKGDNIRDIVVFAMGTNGGVTMDEIDQLLQVTGTNRKVILMTFIGLNKSGDHSISTNYDTYNATVKEAVSKYSNVSLADWEAAVKSSGDPTSVIITENDDSGLYVHPTDPAGRELFAKTIANAVNKVTKKTSSSGSGGAVTGGTSLSAQQEAFVRAHYAQAQALSIAYGIPWETVVAQGILESASGTSKIAVDKHNYFGIGAYDSCPYTCAFTYESEEAGWQGYYENIRKTATYRNHGVFQGNTVTDPYAYLAAITAAGYATADVYYQATAPLISAIEKLSKMEGWASSAELAAAHPEWAENAAANAAGGNSVAVNIPSGSSLDNCVGGSGSGAYDYEFVEIDGYVFPLAGATKDNYLHPGSRNGKLYSVLSRLPCGSGNTCHHDYNAVDMGLDMNKLTGKADTAANWPGYAFDDLYYYSTGVTVLALTDGKITSYNYYRNKVVPEYQTKCSSVTFQSDKDGRSYWLGHMSYDDTKKAGDTFKAGDPIGTVGPPQCAQSTQAHLHIDITSQKDYHGHAIIDIIDKLYEALPES